MRLADCSYWEYQMSLSLDGELGPDGDAELARHLAACPHCRRVRDAFTKSAQALRALPDLADQDLLTGLRHDIMQKTRRRRRKSPGRLLWPGFAAALVTAFAAANLWLGPLWQRPALVTAAVVPGNRLELTFNQPMDSNSWPGTAAVQESTAAPRNAPLAGLFAAATPPVAGKAQSPAAPQHAPQPAPSSTGGPAPAGPLPYTVARRGNGMVVSLAGPLPQGPFSILVPATVRDRWGRELGRAYLVVVDHGKTTVSSP